MRLNIAGRSWVPDAVTTTLNDPFALTQQHATVHLVAEEGRWVARIQSLKASRTCTFAFYLRRNGRRIETRWYGPEPTARFEQPITAGRYVAVGFVRQADGEAVQMISSAAVQIGGATSVQRKAGLRLPSPIQINAEQPLESALDLESDQQFNMLRDGMRYSFLLSRRKGDQLYVFLGGAVPDRAQASLPRFSRFSWRDDMPGTVMCIADPSLYLDSKLRLGWYFGTANHDVIQGLTTLIRAVGQALGVADDKIVLWGSSGGGFAAMQLAARLGRGATAVAVNAQTNILAYGIQPSVKAFLRSCLDNLPRDKAQSLFAARLSALDAWSSPDARTARCILIQNRRDLHHFKDHFQPFLAIHRDPSQLATAPGRIWGYVYDHPGGHGAEPRGMVPGLIELVQSSRGLLPSEVGMAQAARRAGLDLYEQAK